MNVILSLAPTGIVPTKEMNPDVPISPQEIVEDVLECAEIGITMVHLHARDEKGKPTYRKDVYAEIIEGIRKYDKEVVLCVSLSSRAAPDYKSRVEPIELKDGLKPDMGSLTLSSLNFSSQASVNPPDVIKDLVKDMEDRGIVPEIEVFDLGMINYMRYLIEKKILLPPYYVNLFVGGIAGAQIEHAGVLVKDLPEGSLWSLAGLGNAQLAANVMGVALGGGVRTGLEDMVYMNDSREVLATNTYMVKRIHGYAGEFGRDIMLPDEFRKRMDMKGGRGEYGF